MKDNQEPRLFTLYRHIDESGVSGLGRVLDGVVFHTGQVVICWRTDISSEEPGYSSLTVYPCWDAFLHVHIKPHPPEASELKFISPISGLEEYGAKGSPKDR